MSLRRQVLLLAALTLLLPWAGYEYLGELAHTLRAGQLSTLTARAEASTRLLARDFPQPVAGDGTADAARDLYAQPLTARLALDGYDDDWSIVSGGLRRFRYGDNKSGPVGASGQVAEVALRAAEDGQRLYLFLHVSDDQRRYERPARERNPLGDHVLLRVNLDGARRRDYLLATPAPGTVQARYRGRRRDGVRPLIIEPRISGSWQDTGDGYNLELSLPLPAAGAAFGFAVLDVDSAADDGRRRWTGTADPTQRLDGGHLRRGDGPLATAMTAATGDGLSLSAFDLHGWQLASVAAVVGGQRDANGERVEQIDAAGPLDELLERGAARLFSSLLEGGGTRAELPDQRDGRFEGALFAAARNGAPLPPAYYRDGRRKRLAIALPVRDAQNQVIGVLLASQPARAVDALAGRSLLRLLALGLLAVVLITAALLGYASWLSWRVRRLRDAASRAVSPDGVPAALPLLPGSGAGDELGELARDFGALLGRQRDYTDYLRGMNGRLAHELRTPLAVVASSLENLDEGDLSAAAQRYRQRALSGSARLQRLIGSLSEATRIEQAVAAVEFETLDLGDFLHAATAAYSDAWPQRTIDCVAASGQCEVAAEPALLAQLLDKLVANALDFCTEPGAVTLRLEVIDGAPALLVHNPGPPLPEAVRLRPGEPLGSQRASGGEGAHLGLGLYIARLIAEAHRARLVLADEDGGVTARVVFQP